MSRSRSSLIAALSLLVAIPALAQGTRPSVVPDARAQAMGGKHVAQSGGLSLLFSNPAGFAAAPAELVLSCLSAQISGPVFDMAGLLINGQLSDSLAVSRLLDTNGRFYAAADSGGPIAIGYVGKGVGVGFFNRSWAEVNAASLMHIDMDLSEEFLLVGGYAHRFKLSPALALDVGFMPKTFFRFEIPYPTSILGMSSLTQNPGSILDNASFRVTTGIGFDAGARFSILDRYAFAVAARDAYTPAFISRYGSLNDFRADPMSVFSSETEKDIVPCDLSAGFFARPPLGLLGRYISSCEFMLDYNDVLSLFGLMPPNPFLLVSAGAEITMHDVFHIRGGWNQGTLAAGLGIELKPFVLDIAMFGKELGTDLGDRTVYNLLISLDMKIK